VDRDLGESEGLSVATLAEVVAGYIAALAVLIYPLGVATLGLQLWVAYNYPLQESVYAASLAPVAAPVTRIFSSLYWFAASLAAAEALARIVRERGTSQAAHISPASLRFEMFFIWLVVTAAPSVLRPEYIFYRRGLGLWVLFVLASGAGGFVGGHMLRRAGTRWQLLAATITIYLYAAVAGVLLAGTEGPSLPLVEMGAGHRLEASFLSHSDGYWYVFDSEKGLTAVPDREAGHVEFLRQ
jgi:hypothetical protein